MKLSEAGAHEFLDSFDHLASQYAGRHFREGRSFGQAYLIDQLQWMIEQGSPMHRENTQGGYMEIDTLEDLALAREWWESRA